MSATFLGGCSCEYNLVLKENGVIQANITLDLTQLDNETANKVTYGFKEYFNQLDRAFEKNTLQLYSKVFDYETLKEKYNLDTDEKLTGYILEYNDFVVNDSEVKNVGKKYSFTKSFASMRTQSLERTLTAYYLYFYPNALEYSEEEKDVVLTNSYKDLMDDIPLSSNLQRETNLFLTKVIQTSNPLYYNGEEPKFLEDFGSVTKGTTLKQYLLSVTNLTETQVDIMFNFSTPYSRVHSNGATTLTQNGYTHSWKLGDVDSSVVFYRISARPIMWYLLAVGISLVVIIVGLITGIIIKNKKKKIGLETLKKIDDLAHK